MAESIQELSTRLQIAVSPGFRERLLDKGLARGLIWREGVLPPDSPFFPDGLTEDLLDYAHTILAMALRLRVQSGDSKLLERAFLVSGEAIEAAVHRGGGGVERGFHRISAAVAFHLARYAARAYSMLPADTDSDNLAPTEKALVQLVRRRLDELYSSFSTWLLDPKHTDEAVVSELRENDEFDEVDATHTIITTAFMRGLALFDHAITTGEPDSAIGAKIQLTTTANAARELNAVSHWWTATLASHLIDELWQLSLHQQIPALPPDDEDHERWIDFRRNYIQRLRAGKRAAIELWPSQLEAAKRALVLTDNLVVALPTSAGKTRIAELCILRALASERRVVYVTPLRALSAQVERDLGDTFLPLGITVSTLYGAAGIGSGDNETLREGKIVVSTPEKLDFALRNDASIINDVGLIVLDEGHMLGPNEREVRYEALVQRLLRRSDAARRRIVCLSALFPTPDEMGDLVAWIRQDEPGGPVHSTWRPTRQRFGVLSWVSNAASLDVKVEEERPFVRRFLEARDPPKGSRRRKPFPSDRNELTLAAAWRFVEQEKEVLIYCSLRASVETLGKLVLQSVKQGVLSPLRSMNQQIQNAIATGTEWLGADHPAVQCLQYGIALHHGRLPRPFLNEVEGLLRSGYCPVTIASPTLAQGLNLSASVLLVPSIWRSQEIIPAAEFANVAGRAGRAFVDVEGLVLHIVWEDTNRKTNYAIREWEKLVSAAKAPRIISGILSLTYNICKRIADASGVALNDVVDYVTGHGEAWDCVTSSPGSTGAEEVEWERDLASLDSAILALLDAETGIAELEMTLELVLKGSLFSRQLIKLKDDGRELLRGFLSARAKRIWSQTAQVQRKGYHAAGIGLSAGQHLDRNLSSFVHLLGCADEAVARGDAASAATTVIAFAEPIFQIAPFRASDPLPANWKDALRAWLEGVPAADVTRMLDKDGAHFLQDAVAYRLPWAMEAVRVHAMAIDHIGADKLQGLAALAVEAGSAIRSVITLLRNGLSSREGATVAVGSTNASFIDHAGMRFWLGSPVVKALNLQNDWPTEQSRHAWIRFYEGQARDQRRRWRRTSQKIRVEWFGDEPPLGTHVVLEPSDDGLQTLVFSPDLIPLGVSKSPLRKRRKDIVAATVEDDPRTVAIEYFGPSAFSTGSVDDS